MLIHLPIADLSVNIFVLLALGLAVGFASGMFGVGGGFLMTPFLIFLGVSPGVAVASVASHITASSFSGALSYWRRRAVDLQMTAMLLIGGLLGTSTGVWIFTTLGSRGQLDLLIALSYLIMLTTVGGLMMLESVRTIVRQYQNKPVVMRRPGSHTWVHGLPLKFRFKRSKIYVSIIPVLGIGYIVGAVGAVMGIGGGFLLVPMLIYFLRVPTATVIGTAAALTTSTMALATVMHALTKSSGRRGSRPRPDGRWRHRRAIRRPDCASHARGTPTPAARRPYPGGRFAIWLRPDRTAGKSVFGPGTGSEFVMAAFCVIICCIAALSFDAAPAAAEQIIAVVEPAKISVTADYGGVSIVVFGAIQTDGSASRPHDIVVTVIGPRQTMVVRRKEHLAGIWINQGEETFADVPAYLGLFSNRPIDAIASTETLRQQRIGAENILPASDTNGGDNTYLSNLLDIRKSEKLYNVQSSAVTFLSSTLFRTEVPIPASVPSGTYAVDVGLYSEGAAIARTSSSFTVAKVGVEDFVVRAALDHSLLYGVATMAMALLTGWLASVAFRKD